jgi:hypothetical protein
MGAIQVPKSFADDFEVACRWWERVGEADDIPEIREAARQAFTAGENVTEWGGWVKDIADFQRGLEGAALAITGTHT